LFVVLLNKMRVDLNKMPSVPGENPTVEKTLFMPLAVKKSPAETLKTTTTTTTTNTSSSLGTLCTLRKGERGTLPRCPSCVRGGNPHRREYWHH
jgi:hypothetical protein